MVEDEKTVKNGFIAEEDVSTLLQRYSVMSILTLLQEVEAQVPGEKYDWNELVKKTKTGITNAREYQMLWRHLAYRAPLEELDDEEIEPLDDDSDLDCEWEALPTVTPEASAEAAACVKVLIDSAMLSNSTLPNGSTIEGPLTICIPNRQSARAPLENLQPSGFAHGKNIIVPVTVQKQPLPRERTKPWSDTEDLELLAAVNKCGEGNWANILKEQLVKERTTSQLSKRWNFIKKREGNSGLVGNGSSSLRGKGTSSLGSKGSSSVGGSSKLSEAQLAARRAVGSKGSSSVVGSLKLSEAQLASRRAMSLALDMPLTGFSSRSLGNSKTHSTKSSVKANTVGAGARAPSEEDPKAISSSDGGLLKNSGTSMDAPKAFTTRGGDEHVDMNICEDNSANNKI